ncbi:MAG: hypothetical protein WB608_16525, partial [Terracidiphilus sp.]
PTALAFCAIDAIGISTAIPTQAIPHNIQRQVGCRRDPPSGSGFFEWCSMRTSLHRIDSSYVALASD